MSDKLLPLGTVVSLIDSPSMIMITGFYPISHESKKIFRYLGIPYPIGISKESDMILLNDDSIKEVLHKGYEDNVVLQYNDSICKLLETESVKEKILQRYQK